MGSRASWATSPAHTTDAPNSPSSATLPSPGSPADPASTRTTLSPSRAPAAAVNRAWLLWRAPQVTNVSAPRASAAPQSHSSLRTLLPPPPSPVRSSRFTQRSVGPSPSARASRGAASSGVGQLPREPAWRQRVPFQRRSCALLEVDRYRRSPLKRHDGLRLRDRRRYSVPAPDTETNCPRPGSLTRSMKPRSLASSQTGRRGHDVRHASRTSTYGRGPGPNHSRRSSTRSSTLSVIVAPVTHERTAGPGRSWPAMAPRQPWKKVISL